MPETMPKPKVSLGKKISNMVHDAPNKIKNSLRATVHRESDKHFIHGEIHRVNANQAAKKGNHAQAAASNAKSTASYAGKTIIVTGASSGLGFEAAKKLAVLGTSHLILAVRDEDRGKRAKERIQEAIHNTKITSRIDTWMLDMTDYDSIIAFTRKINNELPRLDAAILNAAVMKKQANSSKYGWEETLQVNTLSTILLGLLLLPKLRATSSVADTDTPVLQFITSALYLRQHFNTNEQQKEAGGLLQSYNPKNESFSTFAQYGRSKLLMMYAISHLAGLISRDEVIVNFVSPGMVATDLSRELEIPLGYLTKPIFSTLFQRSAEQGSRSYVSGLLQGPDSHGKFWQHDELKDFTPNEIKDEQGNNISSQVWQAIVECLQKDIKDEQLQNAIQSLQQ
ncbi:NAD(P)-binding protein [Meira miltonrushii]|uniref:NAD(P)-binding protein n=1 Tax=Meira miltonrushii TaxID=1280837 RepID=A0A316V582_9BASI|nr:NAD(P)-binding protein [Meira miltonrushii]PWN32727.1 NAD(P)-binding protein [Meira miltonrushii]